MSLRFSVVTPSFCQGRFIDRTIQSVLAQGIADMEYVICDGGSKDETIDILKLYSDKIRWVSEPDKGQADAVNKAIAMTTGDIIAWINSDDVYYPGAFEAVKRIFEANPTVQIIYGDADHIDEKDEIINSYLTEPWNYERLLETCYLCQPAVFFRRSLVEKYGNLDASLNYCMDYELWLRYGKQVDFYYLQTKLAGSRLYKTNKTLGQRLAVCTEINDMIHREFGFVPTNWIFGYAHAKIEETKGLDRTDPVQNKQFVKELVFTTLWAFWHWKTRIPPRALVTLASWWVGANPVLGGNRTVKVTKNSIKSIYKFLVSPLYNRLRNEILQEIEQKIEIERINQTQKNQDLTQELHRINQAYLELQVKLSQQVGDQMVNMYKLITETKDEWSHEKINDEIIEKLNKINQSIEGSKIERDNPE
ncbi:glycosyltransferase [Trichocoleus sp. Lan]|uniref:glycosyltransferase family 2 protein n=1 Tax=Trichocoleus sp. Lan TaxID=2933927 RepID=UPI003298DC71